MKIPIRSRLIDNRPTRLGSVLITDGAQVDVSGSYGGTVLLEAGAITLTNGAMVLNDTSGMLSGGDILVKANDLTLSAGSGMLSSTAPGSTGDAGSISVEAQNVFIRDGSFVSSVTEGAGRSGNVTVTANTLAMDGILEDSSQISTFNMPESTSHVGSVRVEVQRVTLTNGAQIFSVTQGSGNGGDLTIIAQDSVTLDGFGIDLFPSAVSTNSQPGSTGNAGVWVEAQRATLTNGGQIQKDTSGAGRGGDFPSLPETQSP